jgi:excisionase family DNA binding protein
MTDQPDRQYYTANEVADLAEVTVQAVYKWIRSGRIEAYRFGGTWRIPRAAFEQFKDASHHETDKSGGVRHSSMPA